MTNADKQHEAQFYATILSGVVASSPGGILAAPHPDETNRVYIDTTIRLGNALLKELIDREVASTARRLLKD